MKRIITFLALMFVILSLIMCNPDGSSGTPGENLPPYIVIAGDPVTDPEPRGGSVDMDVGGTYQLAVDVDGNGQKDPNGDTVIFISDMILAMESYFSLNDVTGVLTYSTDIGGGTYTIKFWSAETGTSDLFTTEDDPFSLHITTPSGG